MTQLTGSYHTYIKTLHFQDESSEFNWQKKTKKIGSEIKPYILQSYEF